MTILTAVLLLKRRLLKIAKPLVLRTCLPTVSGIANYKVKVFFYVDNNFYEVGAN